MTDAGKAVNGDLETSGARGALNDVLQPPDKALDHAWRYFALHAQQRMSVFNFFIVLSGILATGIGTSLREGKSLAPAVMILGFLLSVFSIVFSQLDARGSELVKLAEDAIVASEERCMPSYARIVTKEGKIRSPNTATPKTRTFGQSFRLMFWVMGIVGLAAIVWSLYRLTA